MKARASERSAGLRVASRNQAFKKKYRSEMSAPDPARAVQLLAALSQHANFSVGGYCEQEDHCHRSVLRELLKEQGAKVIG